MVVDERRRHQRAGRAGLHAFAAGDAGRVPHRIVEVEHDLLGVAAAGHADDVVDLHLAAGADAQIALDAGVEIDRHRGVAAVGRRGIAALGKPARGEPLAVDDLPQMRLRIGRDVALGLVGEQKLGHHPARRLGAVGLGLDLHAVGRRAEAARGEHALALDLDHADAAIAVRPIAGRRRVAQMRQCDAVALGGAEDRLADRRLDLAAVERELDGRHGRRRGGALLVSRRLQGVSHEITL